MKNPPPSLDADTELCINRAVLRRGKYTRAYADLTSPQLFGLLWLIGEWSVRDGPHPRRVAAGAAIRRFSQAPLTLDEAREYMRSTSSATAVDRADLALHPDSRVAGKRPIGATYVGEDGLRRLARQHLNHLRRRLIWYETQQGTEDYVRKLRSRIDAFVREHQEELCHAPTHHD